MAGLFAFRPATFSPARLKAWRAFRVNQQTREERMAESVYKVIELIGTSTESWERAASAAIERAADR